MQYPELDGRSVFQAARFEVSWYHRSHGKDHLFLNLFFKLFVLSDFILDSKEMWQVHRGFYTAYHNTTLRPRVTAAVMRIQQEIYGLNIFVTGHSMGGAMAAFCSLDLVVCLISSAGTFC